MRKAGLCRGWELLPGRLAWPSSPSVCPGEAWGLVLHHGSVVSLSELQVLVESPGGGAMLWGDSPTVRPSLGLVALT